MNKLKVVFMGTPEFAVATLDAIVKAHYEVVGVITAPDKPAGRGRKLNESAIKKYAVSNGLHLMQPTNLKNEEFLQELKSLQADVQVVVAFRMLPKDVWDMPKYGTFNLHASLLPNYRGAAPINWAIINGDTKTGVTTFFIDEKIDTGNIILREETLIGADEILGSLHDRLMYIGSHLVVKTLDLISTGKVQTIPQPEEDLKPAPKIFTETCEINWNDSLDNIYNLIRGLNPYPAAWTTLYNNDQEVKVKLYDVSKLITDHKLPIGTIQVENREIRVAVQEGFLKINSLQIAGKRKMDSKSLLNGYTFEAGAKVQ